MSLRISLRWIPHFSTSTAKVVVTPGGESEPFALCQPVPEAYKHIGYAKYTALCFNHRGYFPIRVSSIRPRCQAEDI